MGAAPKTSAPPGNLKSYADFLDILITRYGRYFEWIELWNEPNDPRKWDAELDPYWIKFSEMIGNAAHWAHQRGKKTVLGGMRPIDPNWLRLMGDRNLLQYIDAVGIHAFPGATDAGWDGWRPQVQRIREVLSGFNRDAQVWITETGYSTWRHDERRQLTALVDALDAPVDRIYWYSLRDLSPRLATGDGFHADERDYHFGLKGADDREKLLYRLWTSGGLDAVRDAYWLGKSAYVGAGVDRPVLITGGSGFIGTNLAHRIMSSGQSVLIFDNLSRPGVERNLAWLRKRHPDLMRVEAADVRESHILRAAVNRASAVYHFAAQVAVTTSLVNAIHDFEVNARGVLNLLEALRAEDNPPPLIFTSTNKVYGALPDVVMRATGQRYEPQDDQIRANGISEARPLDFHSPYGCSKGSADQYVIDYARTFGLPAAVFRMSCIYGPHQCGNEDQGWVAHFLIRALSGDPITIYGDGMQVRDLLFVDDLINAFLLAQANMPAISGQAFNIGGRFKHDQPAGIARPHRAAQRPPSRCPIQRLAPGDQRYYVSNTAKMQHATGWSPRVGVRSGIGRLNEWLKANVIPRGKSAADRRAAGPQCVGRKMLPGQLRKIAVAGCSRRRKRDDAAARCTSVDFDTDHARGGNCRATTARDSPGRPSGAGACAKYVFACRDAACAPRIFRPGKAGRGSTTRCRRGRRGTKDGGLLTTWEARFATLPPVTALRSSPIAHTPNAKSSRGAKPSCFPKCSPRRRFPGSLWAVR